MMANRKETCSEFDLIQRYFSRPVSKSFALAQGDDCAIYEIPSGQRLVFSIDTVVEGRHFPKGMAAKHVATRALGAALSDLAAMGAKPDHFTLALTLPEADASWLSEFSNSLYDFADKFGVALVGGDTTKGPLAITIQVHGLLPKEQALTRSGAKPGDGIFLSGATGEARGGLEILLRKGVAKNSYEQVLLDKFLQPAPQFAIGRSVLGLANACIDVSDGLIADVSHIARASGLSAEIELQNLPLSEPLKNVFPDEALSFALSGGDDYELVFALPVALAAQFKKDGLHQVGRFIESHHPGQVELLDQGMRIENEQYRGFQHFE